MQFDICSPALLLASIFDATPLETPPPARTLLITGSSGVGKTTWCRELVGSADSRISLAGFISPGVYEGGHKTGIDLVALPDWQVRRLAESQGSASQPTPAAPESDPSSPQEIATQNWRFISETLEWGDELLHEEAAPDLWVFDELGPLEFLQNTGLHTALDIVSARRYQLAVVVVRPTLVPLACERWPWAEVCDLSQAPAAGWGSA